MPDQDVQDQDAAKEPQATPETTESPFAQIDNADDQAQDTAAAQPEAEKPAPAAAKDPNHREVTVSKGDTLSTLFEKVGLPASTVHEVLASDKQAKQFSKLQNGQTLQFELSPDGQLKQLHTKLGELETISLSKSASGFVFNREISKPNVRNAYVHGVINSSLSQSAQRAGLTHTMTMDMANIFGYDIDFAQDIRKGDEFDVVYEQKVVNGKNVGTGNILSARFTNRGKTYTAVRYTSKQGTTNYYTADGNSMRKAFIRTPVDFARISSMFSMVANTRSSTRFARTKASIMRRHAVRRSRQQAMARFCWLAVAAATATRSSFSTAIPTVRCMDTCRVSPKVYKPVEPSSKVR